MKLLREDRQRVRDAARRLIDERSRFEQQALCLQKQFDRNRPAILLGGGFSLGLLLGRKQFVQATRSALSIASLGFALMRSSLGSILLATTFHRTRNSVGNSAAAMKRDHG